MVLKYTPKCEFQQAPDFDLLGVDGERWSLKRAMGKNGLVVMFICNHCPYVKSIQTRLVEDVLKMQAFGVNAVAIMSNDVQEYPEDSYPNMQQVAKQYSYPFPYLLDETQAVAKQYGAVCTPDFFGTDRTGKVLYRGRLDAAGIDGKAKGLRRDLVEAMHQLALNGTISDEQIPSMGCSIKWKSHD